DKARWMFLNLLKGGSGYLSTLIRSATSTYGTHMAIMAFLVLDPTLSAPSDPRTSLPVNFYASGLGRMLSRIDWGTNASWLSWLGQPWISVDHQPAASGEFE